MTIQVNIYTQTDDLQEASYYFYGVKEFLKLHGWTVAGSSDGATGGMDAVDRFTTPNLLSATDRWIVMQSPHANPADRIQLLFAKPNSTGTQGIIAYNSQADYVGVTTAVPTSSNHIVVVSTVVTPDNTDVRYHMLLDDQAPYGFAVLGTTVGTSTANQGGMALIPLNLSTATDNPGKPYVFYAAISGAGYLHTTLWETSASTSFSHCVAQGNNTSLSFTAPANVVCPYNSTTPRTPNGLGQDAAGRDITTPVLFQSSTYYFGLSSFMRWNGPTRSNLDNLQEGVVTRARICFGSVNFPWDGTTIPTP